MPISFIRISRINLPKNIKKLPQISRLKPLPQIKRIYKIFYDFNQNNNPNRGLKCIYKNLFNKIIYKNLNTSENSSSVISSELSLDTSSSSNTKLLLFDDNKITTIIYCSKDKTEIIIQSSFFIDFDSHIEKLISVLYNDINPRIDLTKTFNYNKLYIS